jgi:hypothetical protein
MQQTGDTSSSRVALGFAESAVQNSLYIARTPDTWVVGQGVDYLYDSMRILLSSVKMASP